MKCFNPPMKVTIEGDQGAGKTTLLEILKEAGWKVSEERLVGKANNKIEATVCMLNHSARRRRAAWAS